MSVFTIQSTPLKLFYFLFYLYFFLVSIFSYLLAFNLFLCFWKGGRKRWREERGKNQEIERGRKIKWRDKKICGFMLLNIELFVQVLRFWQTSICFEIYIDMPCYWWQAMKLHHEWWYNVIVPRTKSHDVILLPLLSCEL